MILLCSFYFELLFKAFVQALKLLHKEFLERKQPSFENENNILWNTNAVEVKGFARENVLQFTESSQIQTATSKTSALNPLTPLIPNTWTWSIFTATFHSCIDACQRRVKLNFCLLFLNASAFPGKKPCGFAKI